MFLWFIAILWMLAEMGAPFGLALAVIIGYAWYLINKK